MDVSYGDPEVYLLVLGEKVSRQNQKEVFIGMRYNGTDRGVYFYFYKKNIVFGVQY